MFYYAQALETKDPVLAALVRRNMADRAMQEGLASYKSGQQGEARRDWLQAVQLEPHQVAAYYLLGRADMDLSNWDEGASFFQQVLPNSTNKQIRASAVCGWGDCYYKAGKIGPARSEYLRSLVVEPDLNYRSLKSLVEYYFK
jgi:tetratricopeptide (TPR) repeat protein